MLSWAVPSMYLKKFRNKHSNALDKTIPEILEFLFSTYGKISEEKLLTEEQNLRARVFEITDPMIVMYNEVDDLIELGIAAQNPYTDAQIVKLGIKLIKNMHDFEKGLEDWYALPGTPTWDIFKTHFETAHTNLQRV